MPIWPLEPQNPSLYRLQVVLSPKMVSRCKCVKSRTLLSYLISRYSLCVSYDETFDLTARGIEYLNIFLCRYQAPPPRSYRLVVIIFFQGHPGSSRALRGFPSLLTLEREVARTSHLGVSPDLPFDKVKIFTWYLPAAGLPFQVKGRQNYHFSSRIVSYVFCIFCCCCRLQTVSRDCRSGLQAPLPASSHKSYQIQYQIYFILYRFLSCLCFCVFFCQIARGRRPTLTPTLTQAGAPTRARLRRAFWKKWFKKCADHLRHWNLFGTLSGMICGVRTSQRLRLYWLTCSSDLGVVLLGCVFRHGWDQPC